MSLAGYFSSSERAWELEDREGVEVLEVADRSELPGGLKRAGRAVVEVYESVEDYDPVLRWHCRLRADGEGQAD